MTYVEMEPQQFEALAGYAQDCQRTLSETVTKIRILEEGYDRVSVQLIDRRIICAETSARRSFIPDALLGTARAFVEMSPEQFDVLTATFAEGTHEGQACSMVRISEQCPASVRIEVIDRGIVIAETVA